MYASDWVRQNFGDEARWLGAGNYGEAWEILFNGQPATLKITGSRAEEFCVESIKSIQPPVGSDPQFPFPYILSSGPVVPLLDYDLDWYEAEGEWSPMHPPTYFYIREYATFPLLTKQRAQSIRSDMESIAKGIYADYGLLILDIGVGNWGFVDREGIPFLVPTDLACGNEENWWSEAGDINDQIDQIPFEPPEWLPSKEQKRKPDGYYGSEPYYYVDINLVEPDLHWDVLEWLRDEIKNVRHRFGSDSEALELWPDDYYQRMEKSWLDPSKRQPLQVYYDDDDVLRIKDGWHRLAISHKIGLDKVPVVFEE